MRPIEYVENFIPIDARSALNSGEVVAKPFPDRFRNYCVSDLGRVFSLKPAGYRLLTNQLTSDGYQVIKLFDKNKRKHLRVSRLVLFAFHGSPIGIRNEACHGNGIRHDDRLENLRWGTKKQNAGDKIKQRLRAQSMRQAALNLQDHINESEQNNWPF